MSPLDAFWHLINLFAVAALTGAIAAAGAKLLWWRALRGVHWYRLALAASGACAGVTLGGLLLFGADGRIATYAAMPVACAAALWWQGWRGAR